jgi:CRISPR-associated helicase Cas3
MASGANLLEDPKAPATWDVLKGVSEQSSPYLRRIVQVKAGNYEIESNDDGAFRSRVMNNSADQNGVSETEAAFDAQKWKCHTRRRLKIGTATFRFEYCKKVRQSPGRLLLDEHLKRAGEEGARLAEAIAPGNKFLNSLLAASGQVHDIGKHNAKWQWSMGNEDMKNPVAKSLLETPRRTGGFRHEWQSLIEIAQTLPTSPNPPSEDDEDLWTMLWHHLIATHHGHLRPWLREGALKRHELAKNKQSSVRLQCAERFARLQGAIGPWRLAYLEALLKASDVAASETSTEEDNDEQ